MAMKTFKYRLYPTLTQERRMLGFIYARCQLWNLLIAERECWLNYDYLCEKHGINIDWKPPKKAPSTFDFYW